MHTEAFKIWLMNGLALATGASVGFNPGTGWDVQSAEDLNGDGRADIVWQNDNGAPAVWLMNGLGLLAGAAIGFNPGSAWEVLPQHHELA